MRITKSHDIFIAGIFFYLSALSNTISLNKHDEETNHNQSDLFYFPFHWRYSAIACAG
jgi:hypothetical protein